MTDEVKRTATPMDGPGSKEVVRAMEGLLKILSWLPNWPMGPLPYPVGDGRVATVRRLEEASEAFIIVVEPET